MSKVYFTKLQSDSFKSNIPNKINRLFDAAIEDGIVKERDNVAVKVHFGERGNTTFVHPVFVREIVDKIKDLKGKPFLTDTNTLYSGSRTNSPDHLETAIRNGFSYSVVNAPLIIADGLHSKNVVDVPVGLKHFEHVKIAGDIYNAQSMIVISHFKGHGMAGFGGTLKNLAMGCASAAGKQMQHSDAKPSVKEKKCIGCQLCVKDCPVTAIAMNDDKKAVIDHDVCYGCGECITRCPVRAISIQWETNTDVFVEKMAEFAFGAVGNKAGKCLYINFIMNVTPLCDCVPWSGEKICDDIGIVASTDPIAIDKASYDLVVEAAGKDVFCEHHPTTMGHNIFEYGQAIGLGSTDYELVEMI